jgi:uncharacterized protein YyaL (SSP411 family)
MFSCNQIPMHTNRLAKELSPYLLQHAHNPVDWYPWGEEAFARARAEDKPIFLSIGYSTCHWCHVMEHESFENEEIAALINKWFVPIKIDREERPDIDRIYMSYVQATTGGGGWPMSVWLTPELKPFVGGTYFPPDNRYGRAGFPLVLERIAEAWKNDRNKIILSSEEVMRQLREQAGGSSSAATGSIDASVMDSAFQQFRRSFDSRLGGFGGAPKFPRPSVHNFLLRYWKRTGHEDALDMVATTLIAMEKGGMNDQLGGGFHRYSVDEYWFVPHFEKMLYDQAQLVISYLEAFQITGNEAMERATRNTLDYLLRDMKSPEGAFFSAEDADSAPDPDKPREKTEGFFYIWPWAEVVELIGQEHANWFAYRYGMEKTGNVQNDPHREFTGLNILFQAHTYEETAHHFDREVSEIGPALAAAEDKLFKVRGKRPRPHLDDKILTAWNGLAISAFAKASAILGEPRYTDAARRAADFILNSMRTGEGGLLRRYRAESAAIDGMLDDYAFLVQGLLDLYEATFEFRYLAQAIELTERQRALFEDPESGGFYASAQADASELMRIKDDYDGAEPSGNSVALLNLLRLHRITGRVDFEASATRLISAFAQRMASSPYAMPQMLCAIEYSLADSREVVVAGELPENFRRLLWKKFDPHRTLVHASPELSEFRREVAEMRGPAVYVCENFVCKAPVTNEEELLRLLE